MKTRIAILTDRFTPTPPRTTKGLRVQVLLLIALLCFAPLFAASAWPQGTAEVVGTVTDSSGALMAGTTVTLTNSGTNISRETQSAENGDYIFTLVQVGTYSIKVEAKGFKTFSTPDITVSTGDRARVDVKMEVGEQSSTVEVAASVTPALQTDTSTIANTVTTQSVEDAPLNGRNLAKLIQLQPGVSIGGSNDVTSGNRLDDRRPSSEYTVNGQNTDINNNMIDGMDNNERFLGMNVVVPSVDAIQEVQIQTNLYDASIGRTGGGVVNVITKSGSNNFHGSLYEFFRNRVLNTNPNYQFPSSYDATGNLILTAAQTKPAFRQNQYGGSVGGPIKKEKTFFFGDVEKFSNALGIPLTASVPTLCERGSKMAAAQGYSGAAITCPDGTIPVNPGDFSDLNDISALGGSTGSGGPGPAIPTGSITPVGLAVFSMFPLPNSSGTSNNYTSNPLKTQQSTKFDIRIDQHFSDNNTFYGRYSFNDTSTKVPTNFPNVTLNPSVDPLWTGSPLNLSPVGSGATAPGQTLERQQSLGLTYVHVFRPNLILTAKAGYVRFHLRSFGANFLSNATNKIGIACNATNCVNFGPINTSGLVSIAATPYTTLGDGGFLPTFTFDNDFLESGALNWNKGNHSIKFGLGLTRRQFTPAQSSNPEGTLTFTGAFTGVAPGDLLEGLVTTTARSYFLVSPGNRLWEPSAYVQDDWRARRWLTLNIGMRYEIFTQYTEHFNRQSNFNPATGLVNGPSIPGSQQSGATALLATPYKDISPRFGFAATLSHDIVLRGGFGLTFFPQENGSPGSLRVTPFNYALSCSVQNTSGNATICPASIQSGAVAHYGLPPSSQSSMVNQTGGSAIALGIPAPVLNLSQVYAPAVCTFVSNATYNSTCPNNPYAQLGTVGSPIWPGITDAYLEQFNFQVQKELGGNVVTVGYVGQMGRNIISSYSANGISNNTQNGVNPMSFDYPWLAKTTISESNAPWGTTSFSSLQTTFIRRFKSGLTLNANYTWSKSMSNTNAACHPTESMSLLGYGSLPAYTNPCFYDNPGGSFVSVSDLLGGPFGDGNTSLNVPNRATGVLNYQVPFGKNLTGIAGVLLKGWALNGAVAWQTGETFTISTSVQPGSVGSSRPDQTCSVQSAAKTLENWGINPGCLALATANTFGTEHANQFYGPQHKYADLSFFKEFPLPIKEGVRLQFRSEIFNIFNTPNFSAPSVVSVPAFGPATGGNVPGQTADLQNPKNLTTLKLGAVTTLNNGYNSRQIQFALKVLF